MDEIDRLIARATRIATTGEELSAVFAAELALVWKDAERALRDLVLRIQAGQDGARVRLVQAVALRNRVRSVLEDAGYDRLIAVATSLSTDEMVAAVVGRLDDGVAAFVSRNRATLEALRQIAALDLFSQGDETATALWRSLTQHLFTGRESSEILQDLADALDRDVAGVQTLFDTQVSIFGRQVEALRTDELGEDQPFLYVHPVDEITRPFCLEHAGKVFSRAAIDELDNGQLPNVFLTGGGYNCRGAFLAVESRELRDMMDTGERIDPIAGDVRMIRERKRKKAA